MQKGGESVEKVSKNGVSIPDSCGAFGNKREIIYPLFEEAINLYLPEKVKVIFADIKGIK